MRKPDNFPFPVWAAPAIAALAITCGCAANPNKPEAGIDIPSDLAFHRTLKLEEYMRPFAQEDFPVPAPAEAVMQLIPVASAQPMGENRSLILVTLRIRDARPDDAEEGGKGGGKDGDAACIRDAVLTVKAAPPFRLTHLYGAENVDTANGELTVNLGEMKPGERRIFTAELEGSQEPGKQRLIGSNFRCARASDGYLFETLEGLQQEWQSPGVAGSLNKWSARNSLIFADAAALIEVGRWVEKGGEEDLAQALRLVDLQLNSLDILQGLDPEGLERERERFLAVRARLMERIPSAPTRNEAAASDRPGMGIALAAQTPVGPWATLAKLLVLPLP